MYLFHTTVVTCVIVNIFNVIKKINECDNIMIIFNCDLIVRDLRVVHIKKTYFK